MVEFGVLKGRSVLVVAGRFIDVERRSEGRFSSEPMSVLNSWDAFSDWAHALEAHGDEPTAHHELLDCPVPAPSAIHAIGLNYRDHAEEAGLALPKTPMVFAKFPSCLTHANARIELTSNRVDWEVELVVVIGRRAHKVSEQAAMAHVAGFTIGQDISDRRQQFADKPPQFCLGKSAAGFGPVGPVIVSTDRFADPTSIALSCRIDDELMQSGNTADMLFSVPQLVSFLSSWCVLNPGDLVFTGTPAGVGSVREPRRYLQPGEVITTHIEGIGTMRNVCV